MQAAVEHEQEVLDEVVGEGAGGLDAGGEFSAFAASIGGCAGSAPRCLRRERLPALGRRTRTGLVSEAV
ncbi:hypothetical protein, partial [Gemmatimonas sp.]|uniref:hypothetical protein n=1 Tax=Gemmatimonas sp. TaxID=1962908 RepID=UPI003983A5B0